MSITEPISFKGMTPEQIAAEITRRRTELNAAQGEAKKLGIKLPRSLKDEGPKSLVPVLAAAARRTAAAHRRTRVAQQEEAALKALEQAATSQYLADNKLTALPKEVRDELAAIRKDIGEVELPEWVDPMIAKRAKDAERRAKAQQATPAVVDEAPAAEPARELVTAAS